MYLIRIVCLCFILYMHTHVGINILSRLGEHTQPPGRESGVCTLPRRCQDRLLGTPGRPCRYVYHCRMVVCYAMLGYYTFLCVCMSGCLLLRNASSFSYTRNIPSFIRFVIKSFLLQLVMRWVICWLPGFQLGISHKHGDENKRRAKITVGTTVFNFTFQPFTVHYY